MKKGVVCSDLFSINDVRTNKSDTMAVREMAEEAVACGLDIRVVIRFFPLITRKGLFMPRKRVVGRFTVYDVPKVGARYIYSRYLTRLVLRLLGFEGRYDYAVCHMSSNFEAAKSVMKDVVGKYFMVCHQSDFKSKWLEWSVNRSDKVFARSFAIKSQLERRGLKCDGVLYSGIPESYLLKSYQKHFDSNKPEFIMACRLIKLKNILPALSAFKLLIDDGVQARMKIYGDGALRSEIDLFIKKNDLESKVEVHGFCPKQEVLTAMRNSDVFLMPSAPETFGLAYLEAMASGCIVIGHKGWGIDGVVIDGESGYLVEDASVKSIFEKMQASVDPLTYNNVRCESMKVVLGFIGNAAGRNYYQLITDSL